ncbi:MAG TPA: ATP-dependent zinc metalloprotease FtsH [Microthrixaceae bacterium]|nr:ATP-dependent zinc metalloprotease FtsH [Microthrixaceae bacterium]
MAPRSRSDKLQAFVSHPVTVAVAAFLVMGAILLVSRLGTDPEELTLRKYREQVLDGRVRTAKLGEESNSVTGKLRNGDEYRTVIPHEYSDELTSLLIENDVDVSADNETPSLAGSLLSDYLPLVIVLLVFGGFILNLQAGGKSAKFGQMRSKRNKDAPDVSFADVAGADEAVEELGEIKEFLENPDRFAELGAKIPRGVLLVGPPGTGKTLLAKAVAGEAGVPFFTIAGSDFVEMFVGVGAARVRDLFKQAKASAPAIIFVDEIDAVGRHRGAGVGGGHDEREQTLNQLLVEMDGFATEAGVILMAATNRPDILDPALLRPGRFDRQIVVDAPDLQGRKAILDVHARNKPLGAGVDLFVLARRTPGFTGADLANVINEAALMCGRRHGNTIEMSDVNEAVDRVMAGPERKSRIMSDREKSITAYHEGGHALVGHLTPDADPIHKVSIVARGRALGWTLALPVEDRQSHSRNELLGRIAMLMGGRTAEELVFGEITTGAYDDIEQATRLARKMVTEFGMSDAIGPQRLTAATDEPYLGRDGTRAEMSNQVAAVVDAEIKRILDEAHERARVILTEHRSTLDLLAARLIERETLDEDQLGDVFAQVAGSSDE